jgi:hypothetical protein
MPSVVHLRQADASAVANRANPTNHPSKFS